ncbi:MAG: phage tail protein [Campylobacteraceae bacterium]|jgi:phage protein D|nr:phage tail protein [Campylobacteraceae bacterium]
MVRKPDFKLEAAGKDITAQIKKNLISLTYNDKQGEETDDVNITLHGLFEIKPFGSDLKLFLGYEGNLFYCGVFYVQTFKKDYLNKTTEITATSADFTSALKVKKARLWGNTNLEKIAQKIANEHNMGCKTDKYAALATVESMIQGVSDLEFLYTLCNSRAFFCMQKDNAFVIRAKPTLSSRITDVEPEEQLPLFNLKITELTSLVIEEANRDNYDAVVLEWHDSETNEDKTVKTRQQEDNLNRVKNKIAATEQIYHEKIPEPRDASEALWQAESKLRDLQKGGIKGSLEMAGRRLLTGSRLRIDTINQEFLVISVTHNLSDGAYNIAVEFEG